MVSMQKISTVKTRTLRFAHEGKCGTCGTGITKFVKPHEHEVVKGKKFPKEIFVGVKTPKKIKDQKLKKMKQRLERWGVIDGKTLLR